MRIYRYVFFLSLLSIAAWSCNGPEQTDELTAIDSLTTKINWILEKDKVDENTLANLQHLIAKNKSKISLKTKFKAYQSSYLFYYYKKNDAYKALDYCDSMINLMRGAPRTQDNIRELGGAYNSKGDILFALKAYEEAYSNFLSAKKLNINSVDLCMNSNYSDRMALILFHQKKYIDARKYFQKSMHELKSCTKVFDEIYRMQGLLNNIALSFGRNKQTDSAIFYYQKALDFINQNDTIADKKKHYAVARGVVKGNLGGEFLLKKNYNVAEQMLKESIAANSQIGYDQKDAATARIKLTSLYLEKKELSPIPPLLNQLHNDGVMFKSLALKQAFYNLSSKYLREKQEYVSALAYVDKYKEITDSIELENLRMDSVNVNERIRSAKNAQIISELKRTADSQREYIYTLTAITILASLVLVLIFVLLRSTRRSNKQLQSLQEDLQNRTNQLELSIADLDKSHQHKDKILRTVAHDLRNPIGGVSSLIELMRSEEIHADSTELQLIDQACSDALTLIEELMEASDSTDAKNIQKSFTYVDIVSLVKTSTNLLQLKANAKCITLSFSTEIPQLVVNINHAKIARVVGNLITNAIKFSDSGSCISINVSTKSKAVVVSVADTGIGIPADYQDSIFELFTSNRRVGTGGEKPFGVGLSICKQIVEAHNGRIWYHGNSPKGTIFSFSLPLDGVFR
jgi:signal transduction histidine kinase